MIREILLLICKVKKLKIRFWILSDLFKNPILDFLKEMHPKTLIKQRVFDKGG